MGNSPSEVGTSKHTKPVTHCTDSCKDELGEHIDTQPQPTYRQSSTHPFMNFSNHHQACLGEFGDHQRHRIEKFVDRNDESEETNDMQQHLSKKFLDTDAEEEHNAEAISVLLEVSSHHLPKMEDIQWVRKNFKRYVLPLLKVCTMPPKSVIFRSGEKGTCTYLVAEGQLEVQDTEGNITSTLTRGAMFGETSMLYDCPRSDTVICTTTTTLWRLNRSAYYALQKVINSPALSVNAKRLFEVIPEVVVLPLENKEKLMLRIASSTFTEGMNLYEETKCSTRVMVIEDGYVNIYFSPLLLCRSPEELLRELGISVDLTQCRKHAAENRVVTWEDILNHPLSETQLQEKDEQELGIVSSSAVAQALEAVDLDTISQSGGDTTDGHTDVGDTSSSSTVTSNNDRSSQSSSPASIRRNVNMLLSTDQQTSSETSSVSTVDTIHKHQSGQSSEAAVAEHRRESVSGSRARPLTATAARRDVTVSSRPGTASLSTSSKHSSSPIASASASFSSKTSPLMSGSGSVPGPLRQASTGRLFIDRAPLDHRNSPNHHLPSSPVALPPMDMDRISGTYRSTQRGTSEKIQSTSTQLNSFSPLSNQGSNTNSPTSNPPSSLGSNSTNSPHHSASSGVRFLTSSSKSPSNSGSSSSKLKSMGTGATGPGPLTLAHSRRDLHLNPIRQTSSRKFVLVEHPYLHIMPSSLSPSTIDTRQPGQPPLCHDHSTVHFANIPS